VNLLFIAFLSALLGAEPSVQTVKPSPPAQHKSASETPADPVEQEYEKILAQDEKALNEVERIVKEADAFAQKGARTPPDLLAEKVNKIIDPVRKSYVDFLAKNPKHVEAGLAYGSFLNEIGETEEAINQWEKVREMAPTNPAAWNNLANIYGHIGPVKKAFQYYEKAMELDPKEPVYFENMATTVYLYRRDAMDMYRISEEEVFNKSLDLYKAAMRLDPTNLVLATDFAQSYYGIKPLRSDDAIAAWNHALSLAKSDVEKQGIFLHLARVELNSGKFDEAQSHLDKVKDPDMDTLKKRLQKNLDQKKALAPPSEKAKVL
jgi:tetratricopeptide (TPR) repeat protein